MGARFRFPLETLLTVRRLEEDQAKRKVGAALAEIARVDEQLRAERGELRRSQAALLEGQRPGTLRPDDVRRTRVWIGHVQRSLAIREQQRQQLVTETEKQREALRAARMRTRMIERLREKKAEAFQQAELRREEAQADEMARQLLWFHPPTGAPVAVRT